MLNKLNKVIFAFYILTLFITIKVEAKVNVDEKFKTSCDSKNFIKYVDKYVINKETGVYQPSLWSFANSSPFIIDYIKYENEIYIQNYVKKGLAPFLAFFALVIVTLICLIVFCVCCLRPYLFCKKQENDNEKWKNNAFKIVVICSMLGGLLCIGGIYYTIVFVNSLNYFSCSTMAFYFNLKNGKPNFSPKWLGFIEIFSFLDSLSEETDYLANNYESTFIDLDNTLEKNETLINLMRTFHNDFEYFSITNFYPTNTPSGSFTPDYTKIVGSLNTNFMTEYENKSENKIDTINMIRELSKSTKEYSSVIKDLIKMLNDKLKLIKKKLDEISSNIIESWFKIMDMLSQDIIKVFYVLFGIILLGHILNILFIFPFKRQNKYQWARYFNHLAWVIITLLTIFTFFIGGFLGCLSIFSKDSIGLINFIFSQNNLMDKRYILEEKILAETINICLFHGGDLPTELFGLQNTEVDNLNKIYHLRTILKSFNNIDPSQIGNYIEPTSINQYLTSLQSYSDDVSTIITDNENSPKSILGMLNRWSNSGDPNTYQKGCTTFTNDQWVFKKDLCGAGYTYFNKQQAPVNGKNCFVLSEWSSDSVKLRYQSIPSGCTIQSNINDFQKIGDAINFYWVSLDNISKQNSQLISNMKIKLNEISVQYKDLTTKLITLSTKIIEYTNQLNILLSKNLKENQQLYNVIDCSYLKYDLYVLYANLKDNLSKNALGLGIIFCLMSVFNLVGQGFLVFFIIKNIQKVRKYELVDEEDKENINKINNPGMVELKTMNLQK